jgi:hypothetical protein
MVVQPEEMVVDKKGKSAEKDAEKEHVKDLREGTKAREQETSMDDATKANVMAATDGGRLYELYKTAAAQCGVEVEEYADMDETLRQVHDRFARLLAERHGRF